MKKTLIAIAGEQTFKITSVRDFKFAVVARPNVDRYLALRDSYSTDQVAQFEEYKATGKKFNLFLDSWTSRLDLAEKKATALRNLIRDGIPCYIDIEIVPVKQYFGPKS